VCYTLHVWFGRSESEQTVTITIDLAPDLEQQIRKAAAQAGLAPGAYIAETLRQQLRTASKVQATAPHVSAREAELLLIINQSLSAITWTRYRELIANRQAETLASNEQDELVALTDAIETANVARIAAAAELAHIRHTTIEAILQALGLTAAAHA
jgi:hypothetical protein